MILVTGASGNNGVELIKLLSSAGVAVRGMVHKRVEHAEESPPGVEYVRADFDDPASVRRALDGVDRAFLVTNSSERAESKQRAPPVCGASSTSRNYTRPRILRSGSCVITQPSKRRSARRG